MPITPEVLSKYRNDIFIETGTGTGNGIESAIKSGFTNLSTVEIDPNLFEETSLKLTKYINENFPNVFCSFYKGNSVDFISRAIQYANSKGISITFWLDAHINDNTKTYNASPNPLLEELNIIFTRCKTPHTILIDDRRLFSGRGIPLWRNINERLITSIVPKEKYTISYEDGYVKDDIIVLTQKVNNET